MTIDIESQVERIFSTLPREERAVIISHGVALRLSNLRKRHFLAQSKVRYFEEKHKITLALLDTDGLPDDADYELHEDYIMWHHWVETETKLRQDIEALEQIAQQGLYTGHILDAGH